MELLSRYYSVLTESPSTACALCSGAAVWRDSDDDRLGYCQNHLPGVDQELAVWVAASFTPDEFIAWASNLSADWRSELSSPQETWEPLPGETVMPGLRGPDPCGVFFRPFLCDLGLEDLVVDWTYVRTAQGDPVVHIGIWAQKLVEMLAWYAREGIDKGVLLRLTPIAAEVEIELMRGGVDGISSATRLEMMGATGVDDPSKLVSRRLIFQTMGLSGLLRSYLPRRK